MSKPGPRPAPRPRHPTPLNGPVRETTTNVGYRPPMQPHGSPLPLPTPTDQRGGWGGRR